jgi:hypothetical protein
MLRGGTKQRLCVRTHSIYTLARLKIFVGITRTTFHKNLIILIKRKIKKNKFVLYNKNIKLKIDSNACVGYRGENV